MNLRNTFGVVNAGIINIVCLKDVIFQTIGENNWHRSGRWKDEDHGWFMLTVSRSNHLLGHQDSELPPQGVSQGLLLRNTQTPCSHFSSHITTPTLCFLVQATGSISCVTLDKSFYLSKPVSLTVKWDWVQKSEHVHTKTCTGMFKTDLLATAKIWKQPKCPPGKWIKKLWYIHTMVHYLAIKRNMDESQNHAGKKPDTKEYIPCDNIYVEFWKRQNESLEQRQVGGCLGSGKWAIKRNEGTWNILNGGGSYKGICVW